MIVHASGTADIKAIIMRSLDAKAASLSGMAEHFLQPHLGDVADTLLHDLKRLGYEIKKDHTK